MQFFKIFLYHNYILPYFCTKSQQKREKSPLFTGLFSWISKFSQKWNLLLYLTFSHIFHILAIIIVVIIVIVVIIT